MTDPETVFLSYRREVSWAMAHLVRNDLVAHGFDVFMDVHSIDMGEFEHVILREIESRVHFLVLLEPRSFDRLADEGDWLRREIAHALLHRRNIVPLLANGARMPAPAMLPADVTRLPSFNAVSVPQDYFSAAMQKLRGRFLRAPDQVPPPVLTTRRAATARLSSVDLPGGIAPELTVLRVGPGIRLTWSDVQGAGGYVVEQSSTSDFADAAAFTHTDRRHSAVRVALPGRTYYRVRASGFVGDPSDTWSNVVEVAGWYGALDG